jgi:hypothetical protein
VWAAILSGLQAAGAEAEVIDWVVSVGSTINRAHAHAAGGRRHPQAMPAADQSPNEPEAGSAQRLDAS